MSNLLLDERPLLVMPKLAAAIGLKESIFLQQLHYWLERSKHIKDGEKWVYNSVSEWQEQFPFWSVSTIRRIIKSLEDKGLVVSGNFNSLSIDNTKWYRINYQKINDIDDRNTVSRNEQTSSQNEQMVYPERTNQLSSLNRPLPESTSEITSKIDINDYDDDPVEKSETAFSFYQLNGFGILTPHVGDKIGAWIDDLSEELVIYALKLSIENNARTWRYAETILRNWFNKKFTTIAEIEAENKKREDSKQQNISYPKRIVREEKIPTTFNQPPPELSEQERKKIDDERRKLQEEFKRRG